MTPEGPEDPFPFHDDPWWHKALTLAFVILPLALTVWAVVRLWGSHVSWLDLGLLVGMWCFSGLGISVGYHRMLTHRAFEAKPAVRALLLIAGSTALQGPAADWAATHVKHHAKADREGDPHSPVEGLFHAHLGWLLRDRFVRSGTVYRGLKDDPVVRWVSRTFLLWATLGIIAPGVIGGLITGTMAGFWSGILWGGFVRVFLGHHITWSVNSVAHMMGTRPYETKDLARNNAVVAVLGFGEGWHNNHHAFPRAAYIGMRWWQVDPGRLLIRVLHRLGLITNVWNPSPEERRARRSRNAAQGNADAGKIGSTPDKA